MYALAVEGTAITDSATELAESYLASSESAFKAAESLVACESLKAFSSGFAFDVVGDVLLPLTVTADVCSSLFIQMRLCAAVAVTGGHSTDDPRVRLLCWGAVAGDACADTISSIVVRLMSRALTIPEAEGALLAVVRSELLMKGRGLSLKEGLLVSLLGGALNGLTGQLAIRLFIPPPIPPCAA